MARGAVRRGVGTGPAAVLALATALAHAAVPVAAAEVLAGPVPARVVAVLDGDTLEVEARIWLGQAVATRVRLAGIDAPELTAACEAARRRAVRARDFLVGRLAAAGRDRGQDRGDGPGEVLLRDIRFGKFAGRVLARVETAAGEDLGRGLLDAGLARPYGGGRRSAWCGS